MRCEAPVPEAALAAMRAPLLDSGAQAVDPPVIQPLNLMLDLAGEAMRARLFVVQDEGGREACLRPDFTVAVARGHMASGARTGRYRYEGRAFRVAPPQAGAEHPEEFLQLGLEVFGEAATPEADAAVLGAAWASARAGGRDDLSVRLGDVGLFAAVLEALDIAPAMRGRLTWALGRWRRLEALLERAGGAEPLQGLAARIAGMEAGAAEAAVAAWWAQQGLEPVGGRNAREVAERLKAKASAAKAPRLTKAQVGAIRAYLTFEGEPQSVLDQTLKLTGEAASVRAAAERCRARLVAVLAAGAPADRVRLATGFARTFGYYDGFLFEIASAALGPDLPVSAGGRYDSLVARLGGQPTTAVGAVVRPARAWIGGAA